MVILKMKNSGLGRCRDLSEKGSGIWRGGRENMRVSECVCGVERGK